jgi:hypothetical protein
MKHVRALVLLSLLAAFSTGCGDNIEPVIYAVTFGPPQDLKALSLTKSSISLSWSAGIGSDDPEFLGYIVEVDGVEDSLARTSLSYVADSLPPGPTSFVLYSYRSDGPRSNFTTIQWAPADRFNAPIVLKEYFIQEPQRMAGLNVGSQTTDPSAMQIEPVDSTVISMMDVFLHGGSGFASDSLRLWSAHWFRADLRQTSFSTIVHQATSLDYHIASFPPSGTFTKDTISVTDNTILYARITGDDVPDTLYARIHIQVIPGPGFPNREILVRISLQRVPGVPYAHECDEGRPIRSNPSNEGLRDLLRWLS